MRDSSNSACSFPSYSLTREKERTPVSSAIHFTHPSSHIRTLIHCYTPFPPWLQVRFTQDDLFQNKWVDMKKMWFHHKSMYCKWCIHCFIQSKYFPKRTLVNQCRSCHTNACTYTFKLDVSLKNTDHFIIYTSMMLHIPATLISSVCFYNIF